MKWPETEAEWDAVRAELDSVGQRALADVIAAGVAPEVAGARIAHFNDMLIEGFKKKAAEEQQRPERNPHGSGPS